MFIILFHIFYLSCLFNVSSPSFLFLLLLLFVVGFSPRFESQMLFLLFLPQELQHANLAYQSIKLISTYSLFPKTLFYSIYSSLELCLSCNSTFFNSKEYQFLPFFFFFLSDLLTYLLFSLLFDVSFISDLISFSFGLKYIFQNFFC